MWMHGYYCTGLGRHKQYPCTHITLPTQHTPDLVPPSNPNSPPPYTRHMPKYSCLQVCCQSINLKMAIRAETCSWSLCNTQHISNHQIVVFDSWLIQLQFSTAFTPATNTDWIWLRTWSTRTFLVRVKYEQKVSRNKEGKQKCQLFLHLTLAQSDKM
jgi:hypothetical protein